MYRISFEKTRRVLHLRLEGFWTPATLAAFAKELTAQTAAITTRQGRFALLSDSSRFPVQSPEVAQGFETLTAAGAKARTDPTAIVVASTLNKMQAERSLRGPNVRVFRKLTEAERWLDEVWPQQRAA